MAFLAWGPCRSPRLALLYASGSRFQGCKVPPSLGFLSLQTNIPLIATVSGKGSAMFSSNLVWLGGLAAVTAGALLLILSAWGLVLELLGAYPKNFSEEALTTSYAVQSALWLIGTLLLLVTVVGLYSRQSEAARVLWDSLASSRSSSVRFCSWTHSGPTPSSRRL